MELSFCVNLQPISNQYELNFPVSFHGANEVLYKNPHEPLSRASASWLCWTVRNAVELSCRKYFWKQTLPFLYLLLYFSFIIIPDILSNSKRKAQAVCLSAKQRGFAQLLDCWISSKVLRLFFLLFWGISPVPGQWLRTLAYAFCNFLLDGLISFTCSLSPLTVP